MIVKRARNGIYCRWQTKCDLEVLLKLSVASRNLNGHIKPGDAQLCPQCVCPSVALCVCVCLCVSVCVCVIEVLMVHDSRFQFHVSLFTFRFYYPEKPNENSMVTFFMLRIGGRGVSWRRLTGANKQISGRGRRKTDAQLRLLTLQGRTHTHTYSATDSIGQQSLQQREREGGRERDRK